MSTAKRQIPINNHDPVTGAPRVAPQDAQRGKPAGGTGGPVHDRDPQAQDRETKEREALVAERDALLAERDSLAAEREALADSLLRLRAEFENYRRRASRDLIEARDRAQGELLNDLLPVLDNLERALDAAEHHEEGKVLDGVRLTRNLFVDLLTRAGVREIEGVDAQFDPQVHDAMLVQPSEHDEGMVAAVLERGYRQGDRILRPARVIVSGGRASSSEPLQSPTGPGSAATAG